MRVMRRLVGYFRRTAASTCGQVAEGNNTHEALLIIKYRQPADLLIGHGLGKITDLITLEAVLDLGAHHVADTGFRTETLGDPSHGDIAVRDHSHQTLVVADRQHADVTLLHLGGNVTQFLTWACETDISCHDFTDFHPVSPFFETRFVRQRLSGEDGSNRKYATSWIPWPRRRSFERFFSWEASRCATCPTIGAAAALLDYTLHAVVRRCT